MAESFHAGGAACVPADHAERRHLTVLFADMAGSTALVDTVGEERYAEILRHYHSLCTEATRRHDGTVAEYLGDGVVSYFGFPHAREDDALRAAYTACDLLSTLKALPPTPDGVKLAARIGIASGQVVVNRAEGDYYGRNAVGACLSRAARLQGVAAENHAVCCDMTRKLLGEAFEVAPLGRVALKGFSATEPIHVLRQRRRHVSRFDALRGQRNTPLIGRERELAVLVDALSAARTGQGAAIQLHGEAGIGKSRLIKAFREHAGSDGARLFTLQCSPMQTNTALHPMRDLLEWIAGVQPADADAARRAKLERLFRTVWGITDERLQYLLEVLGPAVTPVGGEPESLSVPARRALVFRTLIDRLFVLGTPARPVVLLFEDVHWIDPSSAEVLRAIVAEAPAHPAVVIFTTRPDRSFDVVGETVRRVELQRLPPNAAAALVRSLGEAAGLSRKDLELIVGKSDGVPLFVEEYAQMLAERRDSGSRDIPITLAGLVQSKIDRLQPNARRLAQAGATIGRAFPVDLAARVVALAPPVEDEVNALGEADLAATERRAEESAYCVFKHELVRDAVYAALNRNARRALHSAIADFMRCDGRVRSGQEEVLAEHLLAAERLAESVDIRFAAALAAIGTGSAVEALAHLEKGLGAVAQLPQGRERDALELKLRAVQGPTLMVTRGPGNPDFGSVQARALTLMEALGVEEPVFAVTYNTALHAWASGQLASAESITERMFHLHDRQPSDAAYLGANTMAGLIAWHRGDNARALSHLSATAERYDPALHAGLYHAFLKDFGVFSQFYKGLALSLLGEVEQAAAAAETARDLAQVVRHPHERGFSLLATFMCAMLRGDVDTAADYAERGKAFAQAQGFPEFIAMSQVCSGWASARRGDPLMGLAEMEDGAASWAMTGFEVWQALFACTIADTRIELGQLDSAEAELDRQADRMEAIGEHQFAAPLAAIRGKLRAARGDAPAAAAARRTARDIAERQGARLWLDHPGALFEIP
jgi:class 3 adenylate cyclase